LGAGVFGGRWEAVVNEKGFFVRKVSVSNLTVNLGGVRAGEKVVGFGGGGGG